MTHETLAIIWFGLWGLIWTVYFMLDAYSLGTGMLFPFLAKNEQQERQLQDTIGPFWGGNEVWLITAGGATFAAFPLTYALMFSYWYTPMFMILFALFFRAIGLEFMHKHDHPQWRSFWKWAFFTGSLVIALLFGVAFANLFLGLLIDGHGYHGNLLTLLNPYGLLGGLLFVTLFLLSGSLWISIKTLGDIHDRALSLANKLWVVAVPIVALFLAATGNLTPILKKFSDYPILWAIPVTALLAVISTKLFLNAKQIGRAFAAICLTIVMIMATGFFGLFPNMLPSRLDPAFSVTLYDAAGSQLNLTIMFYVALFIVPVVIFYQTWLYRVFKEKITPESAKGYH